MDPEKVFQSFFMRLIFLAIFFLPSCSAGASPEEDLRTQVLGNNTFAVELYKNLIRADDASHENSRNLFFSPHSLSTSLAMTWAGARGVTQSQMAKVLHLGIEQEKTHRLFNRLNQNIENRNALWVRKGLPLLPVYRSLIEGYYSGWVGQLDFQRASEAACNSINAWAEETTGGCIGNLIDPAELSPHTELIVTQALDFKESWASGFDPQQTRDRPFRLKSGRTVDVPMMFQGGRFRYAELERIEILQIPFAKNNRSMVVVLPKTTEGLAAIERDLTAEMIAEWIAGLHENKLYIFIPRFRMCRSHHLKDSLLAMGMSDAFSAGRADFSGMTGETGLFVDQIIHRTLIQVDEAGSEASASTAVILKKGGKSFRADHPFLFMIRNDLTGSLLFLGKLEEPAW